MRVCNERWRDETLLVKKDAKESAMDACGMESVSRPSVGGY